MLAKTEETDVQQVTVNETTAASSSSSNNQAPPLTEAYNVNIDDSPYQEQGQQEQQNQNGREDKLNRVKGLVFDNGGYPLLVFVASAVLMVAASSNCTTTSYCGGKNGYAVAAGVISLVVCFAFLFLEKKENLEPKVRLGLVLFLFTWWVLVAGITTFDQPFSIPGNGYFAAWGGLIGSMMMLTNEVGKVREAMDRFSTVGHKIGGLLIGSLVVMFAGIARCGGNGCVHNAGYAIAVGVVSFVITVVQMFMGANMDDKILRYVNLFMVVWWLVAFCILTFINPFTDVGNGYFATWISLICSILILQ